MSGANERFIRLEMKDKSHTKIISKLSNLIESIDENSLTLLREIRDYLKIISERKIIMTSDNQSVVSGSKSKTIVDIPDDFIPMPDINRMTSTIKPANRKTMKTDLKSNLDILNNSK